MSDHGHGTVYRYGGHFRTPEEGRRLAELQATVGTFGSLVEWTIEGIITGALTLRDIEPNAQG